MSLTRRTFLKYIGIGSTALVTTSLLMRNAVSEEITKTFEYSLPEAEWKSRLTPEQFSVLRSHDTERPGSSPLNFEQRTGTYNCAGCGNPLFKSVTKYESGTGWPSFYEPLPNAIGTREDTSFFMTRIEVHCKRCGGHLGHVFNDGPKPTGLRYCMNGVAMNFIPETKG